MILSLLMDMINHSQSNQSNNFAISLQYHKKEVIDGVHFLHAGEHQIFYKLVLSFLVEVARHVQSTQNWKLVIFLHFLKKNVLQLLLWSAVMQNIQMFYRDPVMFVVTCFFLVLHGVCPTSPPVSLNLIKHTIIVYYIYTHSYGANEILFYLSLTKTI